MNFNIKNVKKIGTSLNNEQEEQYNNQHNVRRETNMNYGTIGILTDADFDGRPCGA